MGCTRTDGGCRRLIRPIVGGRSGRRLTGVGGGVQWTNYGQSSSASAVPLVGGGVGRSSLVDGNHWSIGVATRCSPSMSASMSASVSATAVRGNKLNVSPMAVA
uniref:Uncharacterized protein n=1 Tax=Plectus sambesii TaxID=2011161 RepID=A0A914UMF5_9BILA